VRSGGSAELYGFSLLGFPSVSGVSFAALSLRAQPVNKSPAKCCFSPCGAPDLPVGQLGQAGKAQTRIFVGTPREDAPVPARDACAHLRRAPLLVLALCPPGLLRDPKHDEKGKRGGDQRQHMGPSLPSATSCTGAGCGTLSGIHSHPPAQRPHPCRHVCSPSACMFWPDCC